MENKDKFTYFLIILLGVLAFFLSTFFFSRVRSAEAATHAFPVLQGPFEDLPTLAEFEEHAGCSLDASNAALYVFGSGENICYYMLYGQFFKNDLYAIADVSCWYLYSNSYYSLTYVSYYPKLSNPWNCSVASKGNFASVDYGSTEAGYIWGLPVKERLSDGTLCSLFSANTVYPGTPSIHFDSEGPYLDIDKVFYENKIYTNPGTRDTDSSFYKFRFKLFGDFSTGFCSNLAKMKFTVRLPSVSFFQGFWNEALLDVKFNNDAVTRKNRLLTWRKRTVSDETNLVFEFDYDCYFTYDTDTMLLPFTFDFILEKIEEKYGSLNEIYGFSGSQKEIEKQRAELAMYLTVQTVGCVVYNFESNVYGPYTTIEFFTGNPYAPASTVVAEDYLADDYDIGSIVDDNIQNIFNDKYDEQLKKNEELQQYIDNMNALQNAFDGNLKNTSLWTSFKSTVTGLFSLITILPQISYIVGIAFGFLPLPVSSLILSVFLVVLIAAIIRAVRG